MKRFLVAAFSVAFAVLLSGCSTAVDQSELEQQMSDGLAEEVGQTPDSVSCPGDLEGEVGATMTCELSAGGDTLDVDVKVTEVDGRDVSFSYGLDRTVDQSDLEQQVSDGLAEEVGQTPDSVSCPGDLEGEVGATVTCELTAGTDTLDVEVEVTEVEGADVNFDFKVGATVGQAALEQQISDGLAEQVGRAPDKISCPDDLDGVVGATMTCELSAGNQTYDVAVEVTEVDGSDVNFSYEVAQKSS